MRDPLKAQLGRTVVAHVGGQSIRGVLSAMTKESAILNPAEVLREDGSVVPVDGAAHVPRAAAWFQTDLPSTVVTGGTK